MRKLLIAALTLVGVIAVVGVAVADNKYETHVSGGRPIAKGSLKRPVPVSVDFGFRVSETDPTKRATPIKTYAIGSEGLVANPKDFPSCTFAQVQSGPTAACKKALVGTGIVKAASGPSSDQALAASLPCNQRLRLYNIGDGMAIRLDVDPPFPLTPTGAPNFDTNQTGCPLSIHDAIRGKFVRTRIAGHPATDFRFSVPPNLLHPVNGLDTSVRESVSHLPRRVRTKRGRGKRVKVGFYEVVGCTGTRRTARTTYTSETGQVTRSTSDRARC
jgi:hypothetical protein